MKKKLTVVIALGLALVTLLSACASKKDAVTIGDILNNDAVYDEQTYLFDRGSEVSSLSGTTVVDQKGDIIYAVAEPYLTASGDMSYERHVVYNIEEGKALYNVKETNKTEIVVSMNALEDSSFFVVQTTRYNLGEGDIRENVSNEETVLYDALGNELEELTGIYEAVTAIDTVYFNGKCYREAEDGSLAYAFDYSVLSAFPEGINAKANGKYYEFVSSGDKGVKIYDDKFQFVQEFEIPAYADLNSHVFLDEEKILLQYTYELEEDAKKYSFLYTSEDADENLTKHQLCTVIYDPAKDKAKAIDCSYLMLGAMIDRSDEEDFEQLNLEEAQALVYALPIVDNRLSLDSDWRTLGVDAKGKLFELEDINGESIDMLYMVGENKWLVYTANFNYLVDGDGTVLGEVSNADMTGKFFYNEGMIFDENLELLYNCATSKMSLVTALDGAFLFENYDGELYCYAGESSPKKILTKKEAKTSTYTVLDSGLIAICDASDIADIDYDFYNAQGEKIFSTDFVLDSVIDEAIVIRTESAVLVPYVDAEGKTEFYRFR